MLIVAHGAFAALGVEMGARMGAQGIPTTVVDPVWALPVSPDLVELCREHRLVLTLEDAGVNGGLGARLAQEVAQAGVWTPVRNLGVPQAFHAQGAAPRCWRGRA